MQKEEIVKEKAKERAITIYNLYQKPLWLRTRTKANKLVDMQSYYLKLGPYHLSKMVRLFFSSALVII